MKAKGVDCSRVSRRVVKLGGSLLELVDLPERLTRWLDSEPVADVLIVVGGGRRADAVREAQCRDGFDDEQAHWLAIGAMLENAKALAQRMPELRWATSLETSLADPPLTPPCKGGRFERCWLVDPVRFMREEEPRRAESPFPALWDVTSDSIAARLAVLTAADELALLKSAAPPPECSLEQLAELGYVDRFFPHAAAGLQKVRFFNLNSYPA